MQLELEKIKNSKTTKELLEFSIINIDKPSGPTSFQVSEFVKKQLGLRKTSHMGTLDPKVTGVMPITLNRACKLAGYFLGEDKTYVGILRLHDDLPLKIVQEKINEKFTGEIIQMPPVKSRVKRQLRPRTIHHFNLLEKENKDYLFEVKCEGGTYIRALCHDLGEALGTGGHMLELRRIQAGIFPEPAYTLYELEKAIEEYKKGDDKSLRTMLIPAEIVSELHPTIEIYPGSVDKIFHGSPIHDDEVIKKEYLNYEKGTKLVVFAKTQFIGIFKVIKEGNLFARSEFTLQPIN